MDPENPYPAPQPSLYSMMYPFLGDQAQAGAAGGAYPRLGPFPAGAADYGTPGAQPGTPGAQQQRGAFPDFLSRLMQVNRQRNPNDPNAPRTALNDPYTALRMSMLGVGMMGGRPLY